VIQQGLPLFTVEIFFLRILLADLTLTHKSSVLPQVPIIPQPVLLNQDSLAKVKFDTLYSGSDTGLYETVITETKKKQAKDYAIKTGIEDFASTTIASRIEMQPTERTANNDYWTVIVFLVALSSLAWMRVMHSRRFGQLLTSFVANRYVKQLIREEFVLSHGASIALTTNFILVGSLFVYGAADYFDWNITGATGFTLYLQICAAIVATYVAKVIFMRLVQFLFNADYGLVEGRFNVFLSNQMLGLVLLPIVLGITYMQPDVRYVLILLSVGLVGLLFVYRLFRGILTALSYNVSKFYLFLYLCTLEILPLVVLIKVFVSEID
jgi:hypothetical protein